MILCWVRGGSGGSKGRANGWIGKDVCHSAGDAGSGHVPTEGGDDVRDGTVESLPRDGERVVVHEPGVGVETCTDGAVPLVVLYDGALAAEGATPVAWGEA